MISTASVIGLRLLGMLNSPCRCDAWDLPQNDVWPLLRAQGPWAERAAPLRFRVRLPPRLLHERSTAFDNSRFSVGRAVRKSRPAGNPLPDDGARGQVLAGGQV